MNWINTSLDIQVKILLYLSHKDVKTFCLAYKSKSCNKNSNLWRKLIWRDFGINIVNTNLKEDYSNFEHSSHL